MKCLLFRVFCSLLLLSFLTGCIGGIVYYPRTEEKKEDYPQDMKCSEVITKWGDPQKKSVNGNELTLVYRNNNDGYALFGLMPLILIIPVPLVIPVGLESTTVKCKDDIVISILDKKTDYIGGWCGILNNPFLLPGCTDGKER